MKKFSFFARYRGGPGEIRGIQMANQLRGRFNPRSDYADDVCIYILGIHPEVGKEPQSSYYDVLDCGLARVSRVGRYSSGPIIAASEVQYDELKLKFSKRKIILIPQHHANFDREKREKRPIKVVGCIGGDSAVQWPHYAMKRLFEEVGLEWKFGYEYRKRSMVNDFYKTIDIQISYRPMHPRGLIRHMNCLKLANAGSYGIPTIAFPEPAYINEWKDECLFSQSIYDIVREAKRLSENPDLYAEMSEKVSAKAEEYHIDNIEKLYQELM